MVRKERFVGQVEGLEEWPILGLKVRLKLSAFPDLALFAGACRQRGRGRGERRKVPDLRRAFSIGFREGQCLPEGGVGREEAARKEGP